MLLPNSVETKERHNDRLLPSEPPLKTDKRRTIDLWWNEFTFEWESSQTRLSGMAANTESKRAVALKQ